VPITINSNLASLRGQRLLTASSDQLTNVYARLSSGQRINRPSDDAAGLSIAESLKANQRVAGVAIRNAQDGISTISIADGALGQIGQVLARLAELSEQAANGTYSSQQRSAMQNEFVALGSEIERIATTTTFNGVALLSGNSQLVLQVGFDAASTSQIIVNRLEGTLAGLGLSGEGLSALTYSISGTTADVAQSAARLALEGVNNAITSLTTLRGQLGAVESRLLTAVNNLSVARENFAAAESRIRDIDVAQEAAELTRLNILQQSGAAVLAQANAQPQLALSLLRG
jgi:flagellin